MVIVIPEHIKPFLPGHLSSLTTRMHIVRGALLFSDISGFTSMSEMLAATGKAGTEELTVLLTRYFDAMLEIIQRYQGNVLKFVGDALFVQLDETNAGICARAMMDKIVDFKEVKTSSGIYELSMKIVIARGSWFECVLGNDRQSTLFLCGGLIKRLAETEERAESGEILTISMEETYDWTLPDDLSLEGMAVDSFLPRGTVAFCDRGIFGEHRPVACLFLKFSGYNENNPPFKTLENWYNDTMKIVEEHHGSYQGIDSISPEGSRMLILFGAPYSHGDDTRSAVIAAQKIVKMFSAKHGVRMKAAVNQGYVYAGIVGNAWRKQYTVIGDVVNTTARLVESASDGDIIVSHDVKRVTHTYIDYSEIEPVEVKGKRESLKRFKPQEIRNQRKHGYAFVGRQAEIKKALGAVKNKGVVVINGEAGIGKSRLLQELSGRLQQEHYTVLSGTTDELKPAFYVFASMIGEKADIDEVDPPETKKAKLQKTFSDLAGFSHRGLSRQDFSVEEDELYRRLPFIGTILFGLTYPGSLYEDIEPQLRYENLVEGLRLFLSYQKDPVCLIFDDLQWTKQEDRRAIRDLVRLLQSLSKKDISFILSKRPQLEEIELDPEVKIVNIDLQGLDNDSAADLALQMLEGLPLEESLDMVIKEKSEGNPFYLEQFLYYLREKGLIDKKNRQWVRTAAYRDEDLPENVFSMIMARIDQLEESAKESLRIASVVGFEFKELIIAAVMKIPVHEHILKTVNERLTYINNVIDLEYVFAHAVIKDVVYDSILRQKRAKIHRSIGDAIEKTYTDSLFDFHEALAYHYYHGQDWEKALAFAVSAGEKTRSAYRNEEALMYYERAIEIISEYLPQASEKLMVLHEQTGELYLTIGRYQDAERHYDEMLSASRDDILWQIRTLRLKATIKENMSQFDACVKLLDEAQALLASCEKTIDIQIEEALVNNVGCNVDRVKGNMQRAIQRGNDVIKQLRGIKTKKRDIKQRIDLACAGVIRSLCGIYYSLGQYETAIETYQEAQRIYEARADKCNIAATYGHMGLFYHGLHDYRRAIKLQKQCLDLHDELGHRRGAGIASGNLGLVYRDNGEYVKALECFERHLITSKELGDRLGEGIASANIGAVHHYKGDYDSALEYYDHHRVISEKLGDKFGLARACENIGAIHFVRGEFLAASEHFVKQLSAFQLIGNKEGVANACVNLSQSSIKTGKYHEAQKFLEKAEQLYDDINATFALSQVYCGFAEVFFKAGEDHDRALQYAEKAYALSKETDNDLDKIHALLISAQILEKCGKDDGVAGCYRDALRLSEKMGSKYDLAETHFLFGKYLGRKDDPRAVEHFASAEQGFMDMKLQNRLKEAQDCRENQH